MKYILNKKIFYANLILGIILVSTIMITGKISPFKPAYIIDCPESATNKECTVVTNYGSITVPAGETKEINNSKQLINIANYGVWIMITISMIINHLIYNRQYPIKKKMKLIWKTIREN